MAELTPEARLLADAVNASVAELSKSINSDLRFDGVYVYAKAVRMAFTNANADYVSNWAYMASERNLDRSTFLIRAAGAASDLRHLLSSNLTEVTH